MSVTLQSRAFYDIVLSCTFYGSYYADASVRCVDTVWVVNGTGDSESEEVEAELLDVAIQADPVPVAAPADPRVLVKTADVTFPNAYGGVADGAPKVAFCATIWSDGSSQVTTVEPGIVPCHVFPLPVKLSSMS